MKIFKKIILIGYAPSDLEQKEWQRIKNFSQEALLLPKDAQGMNNNLKDTDCLLVKLGATIDKQMIDTTPMLKYIGMLGTGYGRIDTEYAAKKGITVCNIAGYSKEGVAEFAFGVLIEQIREIVRARLQAANGDYSEATFTGTELKGKNFGVIGLGNIGNRIAEIANKGFHANVSYWSRHRKKDTEKNGIKYEDVNKLLANSDFVSLNLAYVPETKEFIDEQKIRLIKHGAIVLNLAPMELIDIDALEKRLKKGDITFILDHTDELSFKQVTQLAKYKNCIMYPPIGYVTKEAKAAKIVMFVDNMENFLQGRSSNKIY